MLLPLIQVILTALLISYAAFWRRQQAKRRAKSWNGIISQLRGNDWGIEEISERFLYKSEVQVTTKDVWQRIHGCQGLWAMYKNSPVLVQLADYAAEHGQGVDLEMLEGLRSDAFQIRLVCATGTRTVCVFRFLRWSSGECAPRGRDLQRHAGTAHSLHSGVLNTTVSQLPRRGRLAPFPGLPTCAMRSIRRYLIVGICARSVFFARASLSPNPPGFDPCQGRRSERNYACVDDSSGSLRCTEAAVLSCGCY